MLEDLIQVFSSGLSWSWLWLSSCSFCCSACTCAAKRGQRGDQFSRTCLHLKHKQTEDGLCTQVKKKWTQALRLNISHHQENMLKTLRNVGAIMMDTSMISSMPMKAKKCPLREQHHHWELNPQVDYHQRIHSFWELELQSNTDLSQQLSIH